jgi:hypothetical protein
MTKIILIINFNILPLKYFIKLFYFKLFQDLNIDLKRLKKYFNS